MRRAAFLCAVWVPLLVASEVRAGRSAADPSMKALVLEIAPDRVTIVVSDSGEWDGASSAAAKRGIESATGIPASHVILASTKAAGAPKPNAAKAVEAVRAASAGLVPAVLLSGGGHEDSVGFYRRFLMKDGSVRPDPPRGDPQIVQPAGEADPELHWLQVDAAGGVPMAGLVTFPLSAELTAYPAVTARVLGKFLGPGSAALIAVAPSANLSPVNVKAKEPASAQRIGTIIAAETLKASARAKPLAASRMRVSREIVRLTGGVEAEVQVLALGERFAIVAMPGDLFSELGIAIRRASPFPETMVIGLANASAGVIPTAKAFKEGGEDVTRARVQPGGGEQLAEAALRLLGLARREVGVR